MRFALARHDRIFIDIVEAHDGYIFHTGGDGFGAAFLRAGDAVAVAVAVQQSMAATDWGGSELRVRMSLHTGEAHEREGNYFGPVLNQAARLMAIAHGGQVLVSSVTAALLDPEWDLLDLGEHRLKDLAAALRVLQVRAQGLALAFPPLRSLSTAPTNLPTLLTSFVGRSQDVDRLADVLAGHRLVTLVGPGGIGKTRLALQTAAVLVHSFPDGVWLVELAQLDDSGDVAQVTAATLGVRTSADRGPVIDIVGWLRSQQALVVLDNCEHVLRAAGELAIAVVSGCPRVTVLATSREGLAVAGEQVWPVAPLGVQDAAVTLFEDRARGVAPAFDLGVHRLAVEDICRRLDGVPLAIELAAAHVQGLDPADIALLLNDRFRLLSGGRRAGIERQRTLRATVEWSHDLLDEPSRLLFARLAAFTGWFDLAAARAVCSFDPLDPFTVVEALQRLVEQSMVVVEERPSGRRYRLLETLRQFGLEHLATQGPDLVAQRHAHYHRDWIERLRRELEGPDELRALARLDDGWDNLRTAHAWALDHADAETALRICSALLWETERRSRFEGAEWALRAIALPGAENHPEVVDTLVVATLGPSIRASTDEKSALVERAAHLCRDHGWKPTAALRYAQALRSWVALDLDATQASFAASLALAREGTDLVHKARCLTLLSTVYGLKDESAEAHRLAALAVDVAEASGNPTTKLHADANVVSMLPDFREQLGPARNLLVRAQPLRNHLVLNTMAGFISSLEARAGDPQLAARELRVRLQRLVDTAALGGWYFMAPDIFIVLVRNGSYASAATVHGHAERYLAHNPSRTSDDRDELARLAEHLSIAETSQLSERGRQLGPEAMAKLVLAELDRLQARGD